MLGKRRQVVLLFPALSVLNDKGGPLGKRKEVKRRMSKATVAQQFHVNPTGRSGKDTVVVFAVRGLSPRQLASSCAENTEDMRLLFILHSAGFVDLSD